MSDEFFFVKSMQCCIMSTIVRVDDEGRYTIKVEECKKFAGTDFFFFYPRELKFFEGYHLD